MRGIFPICEVLKELITYVFEKKSCIMYHSHSKAFFNTKEGTTHHTIPQSTVFEDNNACLKFA